MCDFDLAWDIREGDQNNDSFSIVHAPIRESALASYSASVFFPLLIDHEWVIDRGETCLSLFTVHVLYFIILI